MTKDFTPWEERKCMNCYHPRVMHLYGDWSNCTKGGCACLRFRLYSSPKVENKEFNNSNDQDTNGENAEKSDSDKSETRQEVGS